MERDFEKDIIELDAAIKSNAERDNTFTLSVLQRVKAIMLQQKEKLKAYEDTGLEPCEIPVLLDRLKHASEQWDIWCDAYQKDVPVWIPVAERIPAENEYRVVCAAHSGKPFLRRFEVAYVTDTVGYQFGYYDGYKWIDKSNKEIPNVVAWKNHEPFNPQN